MFDDIELTSMRSAFEGLMPDTCNVLTLTNTPDGHGGVTETWGTAGTAIRCRVDPMQGSESLAGGAVYPTQQMVLTMPYNTVVTSTGRIEHNSTVYEVKSIDSDKSWKITTRVVLEAI